MRPSPAGVTGTPSAACSRAAAGLVTSEKKGQFVHYSLVRESLVNTLNDYVQEVCPVSRPLKAESAALGRKTES